MPSKAELAYRAVLRAGFKLAGASTTTPEEAAAWLLREERARGEWQDGKWVERFPASEIDRLLSEEAALHRGVRHTCPYCGGTPPCPPPTTPQNSI